jgi:hypothetical protein
MAISYATPFWQLSPARRLLRLCRVALGTLLVLPLMAVCAYFVGMLVLQPLGWDSVFVFFIVLFLAFLSILGARIMVWRPSPPPRSAFRFIPPPSHDDPPGDSLVPAPLKPITPRSGAAAKALPHETSDETSSGRG